MFKRNRKPRKKLEGKDERIVVLVGIAILLVGAFLPIPSVRLVIRLGFAAAAAILFALIYKLIRYRSK